MYVYDVWYAAKNYPSSITGMLDFAFDELIVILTTCPLSFLGDLGTALWPHLFSFAVHVPVESSQCQQLRILIKKSQAIHHFF